MANTSPIEFIQQVRREAARVTWPTRKETVITTVMVFIFVFMAAIYFFVLDQILSWAVKAVLGLGG